jgi:hypothetical protein
MADSRDHQIPLRDDDDLGKVSNYKRISVILYHLLKLAYLHSPEGRILS